MCRILGKLCNLGFKSVSIGIKLTVRLLEPGIWKKIIQDHAFLKTKILKFFANGPITFMNLRAVSKEIG